MPVILRRTTLHKQTTQQLLTTMREYGTVQMQGVICWENLWKNNDTYLPQIFTADNNFMLSLQICIKTKAQ